MAEAKVGADAAIAVIVATVTFRFIGLNSLIVDFEVGTATIQLHQDLVSNFIGSSKIFACLTDLPFVPFTYVVIRGYEQVVRINEVLIKELDYRLRGHHLVVFLLAAKHYGR